MNQTLEDFLKSPRPDALYNWKGKLTPIKWPKGVTLARCGDAHLIQTSKKTYAVVYGLQANLHLDRETACSDFGQCCIHQAECESLTIQ